MPGIDKNMALCAYYYSPGVEIQTRSYIFGSSYLAFFVVKLFLKSPLNNNRLPEGMQELLKNYYIRLYVHFILLAHGIQKCFTSLSSQFIFSGAKLKLFVIFY